MPSSQVQEKRRFGAWMLVTKKSNQNDTVRNMRQPRKESNVPTTNRGNQYGLLADLHENDDLTIHRKKADNGKSNYVPRQASKGKQSSSSNNGPPSQSQLRRPRTPHPAATNLPPARPHLTSQNVRNRGCHPTATRGRGRGSGRDQAVSHDIPPSNPPRNGWMSQLNPQNIFQFGGAHTPSPSAADSTVDNFITYANTWNIQALNDVLTPRLVDEIRTVPLPVTHNQVMKKQRTPTLGFGRSPVSKE
nr:LINE-type retrotransposon LIb DNA [Ipomoea batatas]